MEKMLIRLLSQKQSDLSLPCLSRPFWQAIGVQILEHLPCFVLNGGEKCERLKPV